VAKRKQGVPLCLNKQTMGQLKKQNLKNGFKKKKLQENKNNVQNDQQRRFVKKKCAKKKTIVDI